MRLARVVLVLSAIPFVSIGVAFLLFPARMGALVDLTVSGATATADVRAVYGGLQLACGLLLLGVARDARWYRAGLIAQLSLYGGLAGARLLSYPVSGLPSALGLTLHTGELVGFAFGLLAWRSLSRGGSRGAGSDLPHVSP